MSPRFDSPPARLESESFSRPRPLPPRSSAQLAQVRVQNRRREYLERNPSYFSSPEHELTDPLLHDALIRRFQTPAEREADGRAKGYARVLEGSLLRGEDRLAKLAEGTPAPLPPPPALSPLGFPDVDDDDDDDGPPAQQAPPAPFVGFGGFVDSPSAGGGVPRLTTACQPAGGRDAVMDDVTESFGGLAAAAQPESREQGRALWEGYLRERFIRGGDEDFEYARVDGDEALDVLERREEEERWFDEEEADWVGE
ncbi:hypothetical protein B0H67DRAFT_532144, partial [Lasiosphaeris hirsuta]